MPQGLSVEHILSAANLTQSIIHCLNYNLYLEVGQSLRSFIQGNNFSGIVSNVLSDSISKCSPYKNNHDQKYPDLICPDCDQGKPIGLEVKTTVKPGKGGESHNGHSGWYIIACYNLLESGDIKFIHIMFAHLNGHQTENPDWKYVGSRVNSETGSQRTETYTTNLKGITKLRDGSLYFDRDVISCRRWKQDRDVSMPVWSIFADN